MAQINPTVGAIARNTDLILKVWKTFRDQADLIVFPEFSVCGYQPEDLVLYDSFLQACRKAVENIARETVDGPAVVLSSPWRDKDTGGRHNAAVFVAEGKIQAVIPKVELPNYGVFDEVRVFSPAPFMPDPVVFKGVRLGIGSCEDFWFPRVAQHLKGKGAEILISINGSPFEVRKDQKRLDLMRARVNETGLPILYTNQYGGQDHVVYDGGSFALDSKGEVIAHAPFFEESFIEIVFDQDVKLIAISPHSPLLDSKSALSLIYSALCLGLYDYVHKNNFPGVLIGLSGGIDSALTAAIAVDALGADKVQCVMMPSQYTSQESLDDAAALAQTLGCSYEVIPIDDIVNGYHQALPPLSDIAMENLQSRARGAILMSLSNTNGKMVLTTGNKSELAVGYATLYGDMCGGFNVLKDVYKTRVYELARWRNGQGDQPIIPENIITRPASAELRDNQTDQDSLPPYGVLDAILKGLIEAKQSVSDLVADGHDRSTVRFVQKLLDRAEYKRFQSPPGIKISNTAFGRERRMPITNYFDNE